MAVHGKAMRAGQPRRAAADHGDLPPGTGGAAERMRIDRRAMIGRVSLQKSDRDRLAVLGVAHAGALAEDFGRADPRAGAAENILFVDAQGRARGLAGGPLADEDNGRAAGWERRWQKV